MRPVRTPTRIKPLTAEAWIIVRLLLKASKSIRDPLLHPDLSQTINYLNTTYGPMNVLDAIVSIGKESIDRIGRAK